jgi:hypothetical protein
MIKRTFLFLAALVLLAGGGWGQSSFQVYDTLGRKHRNDTDFGGGTGSGDFLKNGTVAMTGDLNFGTHRGTNLSEIIFSGGETLIGDRWSNADGSTFDNSASSTFGIHNMAGLGTGWENINLVSDNGSVKLQGIHGNIGTELDTTIGIVTSMVYETPGISALAIVSPFADNSQIYLERVEDALANNSIQLFRPGGTHDLGFAVCGIGQVWNCSAVTGTMYFIGEEHYFGSTTSDGTSSILQINGGFSLNDGSDTYVGGSATFNGDYTLASGDVVHVDRGFVMSFN